jgi:misacylated tRNA(Ala) deacylase
LTELVYLKDSYLKEIDSKIVSIVDDKYYIFDKTICYPNSGGQPNDVAKIIRLKDNKEFNIVNVRKKDGEVIHEIVNDNNNSLIIGDDIKIIIDWERRYLLMRYHSCAHVISAVASKNYEAKITGNQLDIDKGRIDFNLSDFSKEIAEKIVEETNEIIQKNLLVKVYNLKRSEVEKCPEMVKLAMGLPQGINVLRIVEIDNFDKQPDAGTHVNSLVEIGKVELIKVENKGKENRRIYFRII